MRNLADEVEASSFRDPSGYVYYSRNKVYRAINDTYISNYNLLKASGLYNNLEKDDLIIKHIEVDTDAPKGAVKVINPEKLDFVSYPYEWSFSQLKDAALTTLEIQRRALEEGMSLKDASAYNIQFHKGKPTLIDTLSFEKYEVNRPWAAYKQFCQHFLAPLALMTYTDIDLSKLMRLFIDGIPLELAAKLLTVKAKVRPGIYAHIVLHARSQQRHASDGSSKDARVSEISLSLNKQRAIISSLADLIKSLRWTPKSTEWGDYYTFTNYSDKAFKKKKKIVDSYIKSIRPKSAIDIGGNNGHFSRTVSDRGIFTVSSDIDPVAVEKNYKKVKLDKETNMLPLVMDLTNPSPSIGWDNSERKSLTCRSSFDVVLSLALIHHLCISNNVPFYNLAKYLTKLGKYLIIEFVPKGDSQVKILLATRKDIFLDYNIEKFEKEFKKHYTIVSMDDIPGTKRTLFLMKAK